MDMENGQVNNEKPENINKVTVRWWDGYLEDFEATEVRFGCDLLWMRLSNKTNRHIPLRQVRWFAMEKESHQALDEIAKQVVQS
jgi:hypothetical protein